MARARLVVRSAAVLAVATMVAVAAPASIAGAAPSVFHDAGILPYGDAPSIGAPTDATVASPVTAIASTRSGSGYWMVTADGAVRAFGAAHNYGSAVDRHLASPIVGMAATADDLGYWLLDAAGRVLAFGNAPNYGSDAKTYLTAAADDIVATPDGDGYWVLNDEGGVHAYGAARHYGGLQSSIGDEYAVGMASTDDGDGYWIVTGNGVVHPFGDAPKLTRTGGPKIITDSVAGVTGDPTASGLWLVAGNGQVQAFGEADYYGSNADATPVQPDGGIAATADGAGYWLLEPDAFTTEFSGAGTDTALGRTIVTKAASQIGIDDGEGNYCNPYGPCEPWCALFATYAWEAAGVDIPRYAFVGYIYDWSADYTHVLAPTKLPVPGDAALYGTGPATVDTSVHVGIVAQVWPAGFIDTIEGDAGPAPPGHYNVVINGPYSIRQSPRYNGFGIYAFAAP